MEENFICECGNDTFWFFWHKTRCCKCFNEYKQSGGICWPTEYWMRRFNKKENKYENNWEHAPITFKK